MSVVGIGVTRVKDAHTCPSHRYECNDRSRHQRGRWQDSANAGVDGKALSKAAMMADVIDETDTVVRVSSVDDMEAGITDGPLKIVGGLA